MKKKYLSVSLLSIALFFASCAKEDDIKEKEKISDETAILPKDSLSLKKEYARIDTIEYLEEYIQKVIRDGSSGHNYPGGEMQSGLVDEKTAKLISYFVTELSGKKSSHHQEAQKAQMFYTSNCGGCHGDDGKGLNGTYPDLTKERFFGIEERIKQLKALLSKE